jgi:hypothetical protein
MLVRRLLSHARMSLHSIRLTLMVSALACAFAGCVADGEITYDGPQDDVPDDAEDPSATLDDDDLLVLPGDEIPLDIIPITPTDPEPPVAAPVCETPTYVSGKIRLLSAATELRVGPSATDKALTVLPIDAWLTVTESGCGPYVKVIDDQKRAGFVIGAKTRPSTCTTPKWPRGSVLYAASPFSLRSAPSTTASAIASEAKGTKLVVTQNTCAGSWVRTIDPASKTGYAPTASLTSTAPAPSLIYDYSPTRGQRVAETAVRLWSGRSSGGYCLRGVRTSATTSGIIPSPPGWTPLLPSAIEWGLWANSHPSELKRRGYRRVIGLGVNKIPRGSIIVWKRGQCGYHSLYGHIEIVTDTASSRACSDYCGYVKKTCGEPWTYIPTVL